MAYAKKELPKETDAPKSLFLVNLANPIQHVLYEFNMCLVPTGNRDKADYESVWESLMELTDVSKRKMTGPEAVGFKEIMCEISQWWNLGPNSIGWTPEMANEPKNRYLIGVRSLSGMPLNDNREEKWGPEIFPEALPVMDNSGEKEVIKLIPSLLECRELGRHRRYAFSPDNPDEALKTFLEVATYEYIRFLKMQLEYEGPHHGGVATLRKDDLDILEEIAPRYSNEINGFRKKLEEWKEIEKKRHSPHLD